MFAATSGYRSDGDAGLMQVGARYYDAQVGRFITRDTVLTEHPYIYCDHDPVNAVDPSGHVAALVAGGLGALAGLAVVAAIDYLDDGHLNRPWWHYAIGAGAGGLIGIGAGAATAGGVAFGPMVVKIAIHGAHQFFPAIGARLPHIQIIKWIIGVKGSHWIGRIPLPRWWPWQ
jgi:RHS repeat-associated protein